MLPFEGCDACKGPGPSREVVKGGIHAQSMSSARASGLGELLHRVTLGRWLTEFRLKLGEIPDGEVERAEGGKQAIGPAPEIAGG